MLRIHKEKYATFCRNHNAHKINTCLFLRHRAYSKCTFSKAACAGCSSASGNTWYSLHLKEGAGKTMPPSAMVHNPAPAVVAMHASRTKPYISLASDCHSFIPGQPGTIKDKNP